MNRLSAIGQSVHGAGWKPVLFAILFGWFFPPFALATAVVAAVAALTVGRRRQPVLLLLAGAAAATAGLHLWLALPLTASLAS